jgi:putative phosphoribosyl transferase
LDKREGPRVRFRDRTQAGQELAADLRRFLGDQDSVVLAIPPDGVPAAATVASEIDAPLDLIISCRIVAPERPDDTLGAVTPDRSLVINRPLVSSLGLSDAQVEQLSIPVWAEAQRTMQLYRRGRPYPALQGRTAVIVDDGLTTGYTMMAAVVSARKLEPARVVVAVPVASIEGIEHVRTHVDDLISLEISYDASFTVAGYYTTYRPLTDQDVIFTLDQFWADRPPHGYAETF